MSSEEEGLWPWLRKQVESEYDWPSPAPERIHAAIADGCLSINDGRWVNHATELLEGVRRAHLAILGAHYILHRNDRSEDYAEFSVTPHPGRWGRDYGCVTCHYRGMGAVWGQGYCYTIRQLGTAYKDSTGYLAAWAPLRLTA